jgi:hypothetical protein
LTASISGCPTCFLPSEESKEETIVLSLMTSSSGAGFFVGGCFFLAGGAGFWDEWSDSLADNSVESGGMENWLEVFGGGGFGDIADSNRRGRSRCVSLSIVMDSAGVLLGFVWLSAEESRTDGFGFAFGCGS